MLFLNISSDKIHAVVDGKETTIEHGDLEKMIADFLYQQNEITKVFLINGPGSFTNLRIATLALNMYNFLHHDSVTFYSIDKLSLYKKLYQYNVVPRFGYIYIGQRKNRRKMDFESMQHEVVQDFNDEKAFVDEVFDGGREDGMVRFTWKWESLRGSVPRAIEPRSISLEELWVEPVKVVEANYMMEPNVTIKEF